jgi:hypothetical protein
MTVSSTVNRNQYAGAGTTGPFTTDFPVLAAADLIVIRRRPTDDVVLVVVTDYTVTGLGQERATITLVAPLLVGETLVVIRDPVPVQLQDYTPGDRFPAEALERQLDRLTMLAQRLLDVAVRTLRVSDVDGPVGRLPPVAERVSRFLAFDAAGNPMVAAGTSANLGPVSAYINTLLDDVNAATARTTLGFSAVGQAVGTAATAAAARDVLEIPPALAQVVNTFNDQTGHVRGVTSFNGMDGVVSYTPPAAPVSSVNNMTGAVTVETPNVHNVTHNYAQLGAHWIGSLSLVGTLSTLGGSGRPPPFGLNHVGGFHDHPGSWRVLANVLILGGQDGMPPTHSYWGTLIMRIS